MDIATKSIGTLIDELVTTDIRCWHAQEAITGGHSDFEVAAAAKLAQSLNARRAALVRAIDQRLEGSTNVAEKTYVEQAKAAQEGL